jgi:hypothetical protein
MKDTRIYHPTDGKSFVVLPIVMAPMAAGILLQSFFRVCLFATKLGLLLK